MTPQQIELFNSFSAVDDLDPTKPASYPVNARYIAASGVDWNKVQDAYNAYIRDITNITNQLGGGNNATNAIAYNLVLNYGIGNINEIGSSGGQFYNKTTGEKVNPTIGSTVSGNTIINYNLSTNPQGNLSIEAAEGGRAGPDFDSSWFYAALAVVTAIVPGVPQLIGSSILGGSATAVGAAVGLTATQVSAAVGASAISAGTTALAGGSVEDVIKNAAAGAISYGLNVNMGGGVPGAVTGSVAGTILKGGDASQVLTNAFAAGVGAGVQGAMTENPDAGKIIGSAARTYIATGGNMDKTLLNTAATAIGTLDNPAKTEQQAQTASTSAKISESLVRFEDGGLLYEEQPDGTGKVTDQAGNERIISRSEFSRIANAEYTAPPVTTPSTTSATELERQNVTAPATAPVVSPVVTDLDLVNQVGTQTPPAVGATELERVIVQGQRESNVAPVVTGLEPVDATKSDQPEVKTEEPKKEGPAKEPKKFYPTVTTVPPPKRPGRQPIITGESPSRLLADALSAYRPAGAIEGGESGEERQNVWNEKSLRLKDALGL